MKKIQEATIRKKKVLVRLDMDVTVESRWTDGNTGQIVDDSRLKASIPTIHYLLEKGAAKVFIIGHCGRPKGLDFQFSLWPMANRLAELLGSSQKFFKVQQCYEIDERIVIFENLRFNPGEEENSPEFAKELARDKDLFVQDAFATCHRAHASTVGVAKLLPSYAGLAVQKEIENLSRIIESPAEGCAIIIGGKKTEDKLPVIANLFDKAENFLIGGVVGNTFLAAKGYHLGKSLIEEGVLGEAREILKKFAQNPAKKLWLPVDLIFSRSLKKAEEVRRENLEDISGLDDFFAVDIGEETAANFLVVIKKAKTIFWNGNLGISEVEEFRQNTWRVAEAIANSDAKKFAGGGDTAAFIRKMGIAENFDFISNGGGATLAYLAGKKLPGLAVLE